MKILFVCNQNKNRSKTAAELFKDRFDTHSAGLYNRKPLTEKQLSWADVVVVMEESQRLEIAQRFPKLYLRKKILCFDIPDKYMFKQTELVKTLAEKMNLFFHPIV